MTRLFLLLFFLLKESLLSYASPVPLLSIDGGGIRGLIPALVLAELEQKIGKKTSDIFPLMVGTSTGGLLALGLNLQSPSFENSAESMVNLYRTQGKFIFPNHFWSKIRRTAGLWLSRYDATPLEHLLLERFGSYQMKDIQNAVGVTTFDIKTQKALLLTNKEIKEKNDFHSPVLTMPLRVAARATSAAPTYFDPCPWNNSLFIDGGVAANNPILHTFCYGKTLFPNCSYYILSLGTGKSIGSPSPQGGGLLPWALPALHLLQEAPMAQLEHHMSFLLEKEHNSYLRLQPNLGPHPIDLADASDISLKILEKKALDLMKSPEFEKLVFDLKEIL